MSETWTISVDGRIYGPYGVEQMQAFHAEGRLAVHSLVARAGEDVFHPAGEDAALGRLFPPQPQAETPVRPAPQIETPIEPVAPRAPLGGQSSPHKFGAADPTAGERNRYVIVSDMKSGSIAALEEEIFNLGPAHRILPQTWILTSDVSLSAIRGGLIQKLGKLDTLFIVDAAHDKAAWFNFGPETDTKMRRMWSRNETSRKTA